MSIHTLFFFWVFILLRPLPGSTFKLGQDRGPIPHDLIPEASGLEMSRTQQGILWTHNDSGDSARIFALDTRGNLKGIFSLPSVKAHDWEDITLGPGPAAGVDYIYIADMGDNLSVRTHKKIYRFQEPKLKSHSKIQQGKIKSYATLTFRFPDGKRDAETIMIDPASRMFTIITKRENSVRVYQTSIENFGSKVITLEFKQKIDLKLIVGGDIGGRDNHEILLKSYDSVHYWLMRPGEHLIETLQRAPEKLPYVPEAQGEGICWHQDGSGYFTISEIRYGRMPHLMFYPRTSPKK